MPYEPRIFAAHLCSDASRQSFSLTSIYLIEINENVCLRYKHYVEQSAQCAVLAGVNGHKENLQQSVAR